MKRVLSLLIALLLFITAVPVVEAQALDLNEKGTLYYVEFNAGSGNGATQIYGGYNVGESTFLPSAAALGYSKEGYYCSGWSISGKTYSEGSSYTNKGSGSAYKDQYLVTATAIWTKEGSSSSSSSSDSSSSGFPSWFPSSSEAEVIKVYYDPGKAGGSGISKYYDKGEEFRLAYCSFTYKDHTFDGWECSVDGNIYEEGQRIASHMDVTFTATWKSDGIIITDPDRDEDESSASSSSSSSRPSSSSQASSSKPSRSSQASSSKPSSSSQASSSKPSSSSQASSSKPSSSSQASSSTSSVSESEVSSESSSSVVETPVVDEFKPVSLAFSISGDIPVTKIEFLLKEEIGENPQLTVSALDSYSVTDAAAAKFIADYDALAAFDLSLLVKGLTYSGTSMGTVTYSLNGTQASAPSNYDSYVLALVHTTEALGYTEEYYMTDGENVYLYDPETDFKNAVSNVKLVEEDGVNRLVIRDPSGLSAFAYQATADVIVEVKLIPSASAESASIDVFDLSPVLLVQLEVGEGKTSGGGIPLWVWIIVGVVVLVMVALVALFLINRSNEKKRAGALRERQNMAQNSEYSSGITGFDDEE